MRDFIALLGVLAIIFAAAFGLCAFTEGRTKNAPCSEFRDGTVGAMPVRCLPWDVR